MRKKIVRSLEFQLIIKCCKLHFGSIEKKEIILFLKDTKIKWRHVLILSRIHQIHPIIYSTVQSLHLKIIPKEFLIRAKRYSQQTSFFNLNHTKELLRILEVFQKHGIQAIPYKGVFLAKFIYGNLGLRVFSDIDVLINFKDLDKIEKLMLKDGYQTQFNLRPKAKRILLKNNCEYNFDLFENGKRIFHVEPHWAITRRMLYTPFTMEILKENIVETKLYNHKISVFDPEITLIITCVHHGIKDIWRIMKLVVDIGAIIRHYENALSWHKIIRLSEQFGVKNTVLIGLAMTNNLLEMDLPTVIKNSIKKSRSVQELTDKLLIDISTFPPRDKEYSMDKFWIIFKMRERATDKLKMVFNHLRLSLFGLNESDFEFVKLPTGLHFLYYLFRPIRLAKKWVF